MTTALDPAAAGTTPTETGGKDEGGAAAPPRPAYACCPDCGEIFDTSTDYGLDAAGDHWKECASPSEGVIKRRERHGLDPMVLPLSPTALEGYEMCPRQTRFKLEAAARTASGEPARLGSALHHYAESGEDDLSLVPTQLLEEYNELKPAVDRCKADSPFDREPDAVFYEHRFSIEIPVGGDRIVQFDGVMDKIAFYGRTAVIWDYKSGRVLPENVNAMLAKSEQARTYPVAALLEWDWLTHIQFRLAPLRRNEMVISPWWSALQVNQFAALLEAKAVRYAAEKEWRPTPGHHCKSMCDFIHRCPVGRDYLGEGWKVTRLDVPPDLSDPNNLAAAVMAWEFACNQNEDLGKALRERAKKDNTGPVTLPDGRVWGWHSKPTADVVDVPAFKEFLKGYIKPDEDPDKFVYFNGKAAAVKKAKAAAPEKVVKHGSYGKCELYDPSKQGDESDG